MPPKIREDSSNYPLFLLANGLYEETIGFTSNTQY